MGPLKLRPHHFLCALGFEGRGYSSLFIENFRQIVDCLRSPQGDAYLIEVIDETDSICLVCPNRRGSACLSQKKIESLDQRHGEALDIKSGDILSWGEAKTKISQNISRSVFHQICKGCLWKKEGFCEAALIKLQNS